MNEIYRNAVKEFYEDAKPATQFIEVTKRLKEEESRKLIDEYVVKRDEVWSELSHQVFGMEVFN